MSLQIIVIMLSIGTIALLMMLAHKLRGRFRFQDEQFERLAKAIQQYGPEQGRKKLDEVSAEIQNAIYLSQIAMKYPVFMGGWSIDSFLGKQLVQQILECKPKIILELGSGVSTILIERCMQLLGREDYEHIVVDHEARYLSLTREYAVHNDVYRNITFLECPLEYIDSIGKYWYGGLCEKLEGKEVDFLLIDGPPGSLQEESRYPALPLLYRYLSERCVIILDDANRPQEQKLTERWLKEYPDFSAVYASEGHGWATFTRMETHR